MRTADKSERSAPSMQRCVTLGGMSRGLHRVKAMVAVTLGTMVCLSCVRSTRSIESESRVQAVQSKEQARAELAKIRALWTRESERTAEFYSRAMVYPACAEAPPEARICGLISDRYEAPGAFGRYAKLNCRGNTQSRECVTRYVAEFFGELKKRYGDGPVREVKDGQSFTEVELRAVRIYNADLNVLYRKRIGEIDTEFTAKAEHVVGRFTVELVAIERKKAEELESAERNQRIWLAIGGGIEAAGQSLARSDRVYCESDGDCSPGQACLKRQGENAGYCVQVVDQFGQPVPYLPNSSTGPGRTRCFPADCPSGFRCQEGNCVR